MIYQRKAPQRILNSLCVETFDAGLLENLGALLVDEMHVSSEEILRRNWQAIHAVNSGELDTEIDAILKWFGTRGITTMYVSSKQEIDAARDGRVLVIRLDNPTHDDLLDLQLGLWMFAAEGKKSSNLVWRTWRDGVYFNDSLQFVILRDAEESGTTTIAGPPGLIAVVKDSADHGLYAWSDGPVPREKSDEG